MPPTPHLRNEAYGELIRQGRMRLGMTQAQLGDEIGRSERSVIRYEKGEVPPERVRKQLIAKNFVSQSDSDRVLVSSQHGSEDNVLSDHFLMISQKQNPQGADYRDLAPPSRPPWLLQSRVQTQSPYFRFGFKLLAGYGRVFGDFSIQSHESNLILHVGRNNWDRPNIGVSRDDIFFTGYLNGILLEDHDRALFRSGTLVKMEVCLKVDRDYAASLLVNGNEVIKRIVPPDICRRVVVFAWGDWEEFEVQVSDLHFEGI